MAKGERENGDTLSVICQEYLYSIDSDLYRYFFHPLCFKFHHALDEISQPAFYS